MKSTSQNGTRFVYADIVGQPGTTTKQLFNNPPDGYRFVTRRKMSNRIADAVSDHWKIRRAKQIANSIVPINLTVSRLMAWRRKHPAGTDLIYSESSVVFRREPWVLWLEAATQLAGFNDQSLQRFRGVIERALNSQNCRAIVCHSEAARSSLRRHLDTQGFEHKLHLMPPGWQVTPLESPAKPRGGPVRILFVAGNTMAARFTLKGGLASLEGFAALRQRFPNLELVIRSDVEPEIRRRYGDLPGLRIVSGLIPYDELKSLYRESDIYWYPAHCLMSVSMLEAMNYGLPVVTTDYYDNPEYVEDGRTGMIIPHHRHLPRWDTSEMEVRRAMEKPDADFVSALIAKTATLIENPELRHRMGQAARASVEANFSLTVKNRKLKAILDGAISVP
jgi:glycosyltransferase involved in cell wall biosynthesis